MANFSLTNKAVTDLADIWDYTFDRWSEKQADKYYETLIATCAEIAQNPDAGKKYDGIFSALLGQRINQHIIFYRQIDQDPIEIVRILHGKMDLKSRIRQ